MTRGLELVKLSVAMVALQGCASIVHVEGTVTVWTAAVIVGVLGRSYGVSWLAAGGYVAGEPSAYSHGDQ